MTQGISMTTCFCNELIWWLASSRNLMKFSVQSPRDLVQGSPHKTRWRGMQTGLVRRGRRGFDWRSTLHPTDQDASCCCETVFLLINSSSTGSTKFNVHVHEIKLLMCLLCLMNTYLNHFIPHSFLKKIPHSNRFHHILWLTLPSC